MFVVKRSLSDQISWIQKYDSVFNQKHAGQFLKKFSNQLLLQLEICPDNIQLSLTN